MILCYEEGIIGSGNILEAYTFLGDILLYILIMVLYSGSSISKLDFKVRNSFETESERIRSDIPLTLKDPVSLSEPNLQQSQQDDEAIGPIYQGKRQRIC